jgi:hypothetical protein
MYIDPKNNLEIESEEIKIRSLIPGSWGGGGSGQKVQFFFFKSGLI